jgi:hypothetical protein
MGQCVSDLIAYFHARRLKRRQVDYDYADVTSKSQADELIASAQGFRKRVEAWIQQHHRSLSE